jgi:hypothetical protein
MPVIIRFHESSGAIMKEDARGEDGMILRK